MKDLGNFTEIFRKCEANDNINSHKKNRVSPSLENTFLEKAQGGGSKSTLLTLLAFLGLGK